MAIQVTEATARLAAPDPHLDDAGRVEGLAARPSAVTRAGAGVTLHKSRCHRPTVLPAIFWGDGCLTRKSVRRR